MVEDCVFRDDCQRPTIFVRSDTAVWLDQLCGLECSSKALRSGLCPDPGLMVLQCTAGSFSGKDLSLLSWRVHENSLEARWAAEANGLQWHSSWDLDVRTGIWGRRDSLINVGEKNCRISRALPRFYFPQADMNIYVQKSSWAHENQGGWVGVPARELTWQSEAGRTNQGASPYLFLCAQIDASGIAFHLLPRGNWIIRLTGSGAEADGQPRMLFVDIGLSDDGLEIELEPGASLELPEILIQPVPGASPEGGAALIHQYILNRFFPQVSMDGRRSTKPFAPLVYNTWFDSFETLDPQRLRQQLKAAKEVGCEIFVVDAGWYGNTEGPWDRQVGDWSEKQQAAFNGRMKDFSDEVRSAGLGFGLWMEPERLAGGAPVLQAHPDWFVPCQYGYFRWDLNQSEPRDFLLDEISRLVETYQLAWMKIDFNLEMEASVDGLSRYYPAWYHLLDRLRHRFPQTFFEGCASGGMRLDLNTLSHFDGHFLSDTVNPVDMLRITQGALLRLPVGRLTRWAVLRPAGEAVYSEGQTMSMARGEVVAPEGANWERVFPAGVDFICRVALPGMYGYSGDLAGLSLKTRRQLRFHGEFYKRWREFISRSICHLLTPIEVLENRSGWIAFQLQSADKQGPKLIFVYRLDDDVSRKKIPLRELNPQHIYRVAGEAGRAVSPRSFSGEELMTSGLLVQLSTKFSAAVYVVQPR